MNLKSQKQVAEASLLFTSATESTQYLLPITWLWISGEIFVAKTFESLIFNGIWLVELFRALFFPVCCVCCCSSCCSCCCYCCTWAKVVNRSLWVDRTFSTYSPTANLHNSIDSWRTYCTTLLLLWLLLLLLLLLLIYIFNTFLRLVQNLAYSV